MKLLLRTLLIFGIFTLVATSCERDDICAASTPTTPRLIISFYDAEDQQLAKPINLQVYEVGRPDSIINYTNDTLIAIPLRTDREKTVFIFTRNPGSTDTIDFRENSDQVTFSYKTKEVYIDRACGFKVTYEGLTAQRLPLGDGAWINRISTPNNIIINEDTTHVAIVH